MVEKKSRTQSLEDVLNNTDLLFEIFLRLPIISLVKFKIVSKSWLSLITDPGFGITHSRQNTISSPVSDFYYQDSIRDVSISLNYHSSVPSMAFIDPARQNAEANDNPEIVHSCNGLILLLQRRAWRLIVANPTTQKYRILTAPFEDRLCVYRDTKKCDFLLVFEPLKSNYYKVVIFREESFSQFWVHIFSSQSGLWKEILDTSSRVQHSTRRIYLNGAVHWLNLFNRHLQFDVETEKMTETQLPPLPRILRRDKNKYFGESNSRLFLVQCHDSYALGFMMLEMDTHTLLWNIKHRVNLRPLVSQFSKFQSHEYSILYVKSGSDMKSCSLVLAIPGKVVLYGVKKDKNHSNTIVVCDLPDDFSPWSWLSRCFHPYIQCLAPF